jgi:hypothetical protein
MKTLSTSKEVLSHLEKHPDHVLSVLLTNHGLQAVIGDTAEDYAWIDSGLADFLDPKQGAGMNHCYLEPTGIEVSSIRVFRNLVKAKLIKEVAITENCGIQAEHYRPRPRTIKRRKK